MTATELTVPHLEVRSPDPVVTQRRSKGFWARCRIPRAEIRPGEALAISMAVWVVFLLGWGVLTYGGLVKPLFLPSPGKVLARAVTMIGDGSLFSNAGASLLVIITGFCLSTVIAIPLGLMAGAYRAVQAMIGPLVEFTRYLPVTAFVPLFILWIGIGLEQQAAVIFFGVFFQQIVMTADLVRGVPDDLLNAAYTLGTPRRRVLRRIILPAIAPGLLDLVRVTVAWGWTYLVVAEMVGADKGLGYISLKAVRGFQVDTIFLAVITIGLFGLGTDMALRLIRRRLYPWAD